MGSTKYLQINIFLFLMTCLVDKKNRSVDHKLLSGLWLLLLHTLQSQEDLYSPGNLPITLKPQFIQVCLDLFASKIHSILILINSNSLHL